MYIRIIKEKDDKIYRRKGERKRTEEENEDGFYNFRIVERRNRKIIMKII